MLKSAFYAKNDNIKSYFSCYGSFGDIEGEVTRGEGVISLENGVFSLKSEFVEDKSGVISRRDSFENRSQEEIFLRRAKSRFVFEGGEYQVYTQFNTWQNESRGAWQRLNTEIAASSKSSRSTQDAAPFIAIWNEQAARGFAFHILPNSSWEMKVYRIGHNAKYTKVIVELGISDYNFDYKLLPDERLIMPEILCYEIKSKLDLDCYKLHEYLLNRFPKRVCLPVIYNTWMSRFDDISYEKLEAQVRLAAKLGCEYFAIDAGWFGEGKPWYESVGDWVENTESAMHGRMAELAELVRSVGMKFGLWMEPERALPTSKAVSEHPEFYLKGDAEPEFLFYDFSNDAALDHMLNVISNLIEKYGIKYIKDDYNADKCFDESHSSFIKYHEGYKKYITTLREKYPDLYITCCGSGGERMELTTAALFDSFWPSDNESPYTQLRIYKDSLKRLAPQSFERWCAIHSSRQNEEVYSPFAGYNDGRTERLISCADAIWHNVVGVQPSYLKGFMTAGPIGVSCDLTKLSEKAFNEWKNQISELKAQREFLSSCSARILAETESISVIQYSNSDLSTVLVQIFTERPMQSTFYVYPVVDRCADYIYGEEIISGEEIFEHGISLKIPESKDNWLDCFEIKLSKK